jgi:hypothetical protein
VAKPALAAVFFVIPFEDNSVAAAQAQRPLNTQGTEDTEEILNSSQT